MTNAEKELMLKQIGAFVEQRVREKTASLERQVQTLIERCAQLQTKTMALEAQLEERKLHVVKRA